MPIEVHIREKPGSLFRLYLLAALLFCLCVGLAYHMATQRTEEKLGDRVSPAEWGISFRPPARFALLHPFRSDAGEAYLFEGWSRGGRPAQIWAYAEGSLADDPGQTCTKAWSAFAHAIHPPALIEPPQPSLIQTSSMPAAQILDLRLSAIVRVLTPGDGFDYIFALRVKDGPLDAWSQLTYDQVWASIRAREKG